jgi:TRAP-type C4-dicarboxylate transport system permease small subunit
VDETSSLLLVWLMLAVMPLGFHENFHIAVSILPENATPRVRLARGLAIQIATILFFSLTLVYGVAATVIDVQVPLYSLPIARSWMTWVLPASSAVVILVAINNILSLLIPAARTPVP